MKVQVEGRTYTFPEEISWKIFLYKEAKPGSPDQICAIAANIANESDKRGKALYMNLPGNISRPHLVPLAITMAKDEGLPTLYLDKNFDKLVEALANKQKAFYEERALPVPEEILAVFAIDLQKH